MADLDPCVVFWGNSQVPVTGGPASVVVSGTERVVVVDETAGVSLWSVRSGEAVPCGVANPLGGKVTVAFECHAKGRNGLAMITMDGTITIIDILDGMELVTIPKIAPNALCGTMLEILTGYLVIGDTNCLLNFINLDTLKVTKRLEVPPPGFPITISAFKTNCCVTIAAAHADKTLRFWRGTLCDDELVVEETKEVALPPKKGTPVSISHHNTLPLTMILTVDTWMVHLDHCSTPLVKQLVEGLENAVLSAGSFLPTDGGIFTAIVCSDGLTRTYKLPSSIGVYASEPTGRRPSAETVVPELVAVHESSDHSSWGFGPTGVMVGVGEGKITTQDLTESGVDNVRRTNPTAAWNAVMGADDSTTAVRTVLENSILARGYTNGEVRTDHILGGSESAKWKAHDYPVTGLAAISSRSPILVTSDTTGLVKTWEWGSWKEVAGYAPHCGGVKVILSASKTLQTRHGIEFWTIGEDGNVCFFTEAGDLKSLAGNGENPSGVYYVDALDLVVVNGDAQCNIWHLGTETLARTLTGSSRETFVASLYDCTNVVGAQDEMGDPRSGKTAGSAPMGCYSIESPKYGLSVSVVTFRIPVLISQLHRIQDAGSASTEVRTLLTYLLAQEDHPSVKGAADELSLSTPLQTPTILTFKRNSSPLTYIPVPHQSPNGAYHVSPIFTSGRLITVLSLLYALCSKVACVKTAINYYGAALPKVLKSDPLSYQADFFWCLEALKGPMKETQFAARCVLGVIMKLKSPTQLKDLTDELVTMTEGVGYGKQKVDMALLGLAIMNWAGDSDMTKGTCEGLLKVALEGEQSWRVTALVLLADHFDVFGKWVPDLGELLKSLLACSCVGEGETRHQVDTAKHAFRAFIQASFYNVQLFLTFADSVLTDIPSTREDELLEQNCVLVAVSTMVKKNAVPFIGHVHRIAALISKALNPIYPKTRLKCMKSTTYVLKSSIAAFPMMNFHQAKQALAVGLPNGQTLMWDLRTCCKIWVWDAHAESVSCVSISTMCDQVATYSFTEKLVKIWSIDVFVFNIFSSSTVPKLVGKHAVTILPVLQPNTAAFLEGCSIEWISPHAVELQIGALSQQINFK